MVAVGGSRPVDGALFYMKTDDYENTLLDVRSRMLETEEIRTRQAYNSVVRNYGNLDLEMAAERSVTVTTPKTGANYTLDADTPLFLETMRSDVDKYIGLVATGSNASVINYGTNTSDIFQSLYIGATVEINGQERTVQNYTAPTATTPGTITLTNALVPAPDIGAMIVIKGRDYKNPHNSEIYRVTDKFGSYLANTDAATPANPIQDELERYQVDPNNGLVRYRPDHGFKPNGVTLPASGVGNGFTQDDLDNSIWHPDAQLDIPYYFGKMIPVVHVPPGATDLATPIAGAETLGEKVDPVDSTPGTTDITTQTTLGFPYPDGEYTNIRVAAPPGVSVEVELNGAKLAVAHAGGEIIIPFYDPNYQNDDLKASELIDPDIYIQRFIKAGNNHLVIKATETATKDALGNITGSNSNGVEGVRVQGYFNGVNLETGAVTVDSSRNLKPHSADSVRTLDWSTSRNSILGIVGKIDFDLGDRIQMEDVNDEVNKAEGVLESLTTIIAGTDINQFQSILSVLR